MKETKRTNPLKWILIVGAVFILLYLVFPRGSSSPEIDISEVIQMARSGQLAEIEVSGDSLAVLTTDGQVFSS